MSNTSFTKPQGWYSRRHQSSQPATDARNAYLTQHGKAARQGVAEAHVALNPKQQLKALDTRLGKGVGATRERARLARKVEAAK